MTKVLFFLFLTSLFSLGARIQETHQIADILHEIEPNTLILIDIDLTAIQSSKVLCSEAWFEYLEDKLQKAKIPLAKFNPYAEKIFNNVPYKPVEDITPTLIRSLQEQGHLVWALTGRSKEIHELTKQHLNGAGIDFEQTAVPAGIKFDRQNPPHMFSYGIIFTFWNSKGVTLLKFLEHIEHSPSKVVFIDDRHSYLKSVETALKGKNIPFVGFHYLRGVHSEKKAFDPFIGNIQFQTLVEKGIIISDEEAYQVKDQLLSRNPYLKPDFFLSKFLEKIR